MHAISPEASRECMPWDPRSRPGRAGRARGRLLAASSYPPVVLAVSLPIDVSQSHYSQSPARRVKRRQQRVGSRRHLSFD